MRVAIVGCGGIGGVVAASISSKEIEAYVVEASEEIAMKINSTGISLSGRKGKINSSVRAVASFEEVGKCFDIIILTVKNNVIHQVFNNAKNFLCDEGFILTLENGIEVLELSKNNPLVKVAAGAVGYNSVMVEHGRYLVTSQGGITIGSLNKCTEKDLDEIKKLLEPLIKIKITDNIIGALWGKLLIVCGVTGLGGVSGLLVGQLLRKSVARELFYKIVTEGALIARALGVNIEGFAGSVNPLKFSELEDGLPAWVKNLLLRIIGLKYRGLKSNIHHSLERGEKTEVEYLNGAVVKKGKEVSVPTPVNSLVVQMVREIESGRRKMCPENLYEISEKIKAY